MSNQEKKYLTSPRSFVTYDMRVIKNNHKGGVFWFCGLSGSGKSTLAHAVEQNLFEMGKQVSVLDGDVIRTGLCSDLSFSEGARNENIRRIAELSRILAIQGHICMCAFISPLEIHRQIAQDVLKNLYHEIYVSCSLEECERRDVKGYYKLARSGKIKNYTGISAPYDEPQNSDLIIKTDASSQQDCIMQAQNYILNATSLK